MNIQPNSNIPHELPPQFHQIKADESRFFAEKSQREDILVLQIKVAELEQALKVASVEKTSL